MHQERREGGFVPKQIHVISIRQDSKGQPDGAFHLLGDLVDEIWNLHSLTRADIVNSDENEFLVIPVIDLLKKRWNYYKF